MSFNNSNLSHSYFAELSLKETPFIDCNLEGTDFSNADLTNADFSGCNLHSAIFMNTRLEKADLRTAVHFQIHPENNVLKNARFSSGNLDGLLIHHQIVID